jgi:uncharacterized protein DUF4365
MIQKSTQQETDRDGRRLLRAALEPLGWVLTGFEEDYGMDYEVQVFVNGSPDGLWFKIQLKSSASSDYSSAGSFVSVQLDIDHARHYALEVRDPLFLIHADTKTKKVFWCAPQLDNDLVRKLSAGENLSTVTLRVPTTNLLPATGQQLLEAVETLYVVLGHRTLVNSSLSSFAESLRYQPGEEKLREEFQQRGDFLKLRKVRELVEKRQYAEARSRAQTIVSDPDSSTDNKFWAQDDIGSIDWSEAVTKNQPEPELPLIHLENAKTLQKMSKRGPSRLKFFAIISRKAAELALLVADNWGLTILLRQHRTPAGNPLMALNAYAGHALSTMRVIAKYNQCLRLARYASRFQERWILARALARIPQAAASFVARIGRMEETQMGDAGTQFQSSVLGICKLIARIGEASGDQELIALAIGSALLPVSSIDTDAYRWATMALDWITDAEVKRAAINLIDRGMKRWKGEQQSGDYNPEPYWELLRNVAASLDIDISDTNSALYKALQTAAKDNSPERVLRTCEHIVTSLGGTGPTARKIAAIFGTQMAGSKVLHCALHNYHHEAKDFDSALAEFRIKHCDSCPDRAPRPPEWKFDDTVRNEFQAKHSEFIRDFNATGAGLRETLSDWVFFCLRHRARWRIWHSLSRTTERPA